MKLFPVVSDISPELPVRGPEQAGSSLPHRSDGSHTTRLERARQQGPATQLRAPPVGSTVGLVESRERRGASEPDGPGLEPQLSNTAEHRQPLAFSFPIYKTGLRRTPG